MSFFQRAFRYELIFRSATFYKEVTTKTYSRDLRVYNRIQFGVSTGGEIRKIGSGIRLQVPQPIRFPQTGLSTSVKIDL